MPQHVAATVIAGAQARFENSFSPFVGYVRDLIVSFASVSTVSIGAGRCIADDGASLIVLASPVTVNLAVVGANGRDAGVEAANTWYALWLIGDSTGVLPTAGLFSTSFTAPVLPAGYNVKRRIGVVRNNSASDIRDFIAIGTGELRSYSYRDLISTRAVLTAGAAFPVPAAVSVASLVPPVSRQFTLHVRQNGVVVAFTYPDAVASVVVNGVLNLSEIAFAMHPCDVTQGIAYLNFGAGGSVDMWVLGFWDAI